jgi:hypothetical protein
MRRWETELVDFVLDLEVVLRHAMGRQGCTELRQGVHRAQGPRRVNLPGMFRRS